MNEDDVNSLVLELVFEYLQPKELQTSRLVNHGFNQEAVHKLNQTGWTVPLYGERLPIYLQLLKMREKSSLQQIVCLNLSMDLEKGLPAQLNVALAISRHTYAPILTSLTFEMNQRGNESRILELLRLNAPTLEHLTLHVDDSILPQSANILESVTRVMNTFSSAWSTSSSLPLNGGQLNFALPFLRSLSVTCGSCSQNNALTKWASAIIQNVFLTAPNLQRLRLDVNEQWMFIMPILRDASTLGPEKLNNLVEFDVKVKNDDAFQLIETVFGFNRLCKLKVRCLTLKVLIAVTQFIEKNCPALKSLEVIDEWLPPLYMGSSTDLTSTAETLTSAEGAVQLSNLTSFSVQSARTRAYTHKEAAALVEVMRGFPNLTSVRTQLHSYLKPTGRMTDNYEDFDAERRDGERYRASLHQAKLEMVHTMQLDLDYEEWYTSSYLKLDPDWRPGLIISQLYPNIRRLIITLHGREHIMFTRSNESHIEKLLLIPFDSRGVKELEINNFDGNWNLGPNTRKLQGLDFGNMDLELVTIRGFRKPYPSWAPPLQLRRIPEEALANVMDLFPASLTKLRVQVDAELFLSEKYKTREEVQGMVSGLMDARAVLI